MYVRVSRWVSDADSVRSPPSLPPPSSSSSSRSCRWCTQQQRQKKGFLSNCIFLIYFMLFFTRKRLLADLLFRSVPFSLLSSLFFLCKQPRIKCAAACLQARQQESLKLREDEMKKIPKKKLVCVHLVKMLLLLICVLRGALCSPLALTHSFAPSSSSSPSLHVTCSSRQQHIFLRAPHPLLSSPSNTDLIS